MNKEFTSEEIIQLIEGRDTSDSLVIEESAIKDTDLEGYNLTNITFNLCSFENCNLAGADFSGSSISGTLFRECPMHACRFVNTNMTEAIFRDIDLSDSDLSGANLYAAVLEDANLDGIIVDENTKWYKQVPPEDGAFIAWKCCSELRVVQLLVPRDARRVSATRETCRCDKAKVLSIKSIDKTISYDWAQSTVDPDFYYERGKWVEPANGFEPDRWKDSSRGIHFFMEREQCIEYQTV